MIWIIIYDKGREEVSPVITRSPQNVFHSFFSHSTFLCINWYQWPLSCTFVFFCPSAVRRTGLLHSVMRVRTFYIDIALFCPTDR